MQSVEYGDLRWWQKVIFQLCCSMVGILFEVMALGILSAFAICILMMCGLDKDTAFIAGFLGGLGFSSVLLGCVVYYCKYLQDTVYFEDEE